MHLLLLITDIPTYIYILCKAGVPETGDSAWTHATIANEQGLPKEPVQRYPLSYH